LRSRQSLKESTNPTPFMELTFYEPTTGPYPEPDVSRPHHIPFKIQFYTILPIHFPRDIVPSVFQMNLLCTEMLVNEKFDFLCQSQSPLANNISIFIVF
jgi:hypothetical protein